MSTLTSPRTLSGDTTMLLGASADHARWRDRGGKLRALGPNILTINAGRRAALANVGCVRLVP